MLCAMRSIQSTFLHCLVTKSKQEQNVVTFAVILVWNAFHRAFAWRFDWDVLRRVDFVAGIAFCVKFCVMGSSLKKAIFRLRDLLQFVCCELRGCFGCQILRKVLRFLGMWCCTTLENCGRGRVLSMCTFAAAGLYSAIYLHATRRIAPRTALGVACFVLWHAVTFHPLVLCIWRVAPRTVVEMAGEFHGTLQSQFMLTQTVGQLTGFIRGWSSSGSIYQPFLINMRTQGMHHQNC